MAVRNRRIGTASHCETVRLVHRREGAALIISILVMLVLDCVVVGTLHLALLEQRMANTGAGTMRLRLASEGAARRGLAAWTPAVDSLEVADLPVPLTSSTSPDGLLARTTVRRVSAAAWLIEAQARQPVPGTGRATASLLVLPPPLAPHLQPAVAAVAATAVSITSSAVVRADRTGACVAPGDAVLVPDPAAFTLAGAALVDGAIRELSPATDLAGDADRLFAGADSILTDGTHVDGYHSGALFVDGSLTIATGSHVAGLIVVDGDVLIEPGARVAGALHASGSVTIAGELAMDGCAALDAIDDAGLRFARPFPGRAWLPGF